MPPLKALCKWTSLHPGLTCQWRERHVLGVLLLGSGLCAFWCVEPGDGLSSWPCRVHSENTARPPMPRSRRWPTARAHACSQKCRMQRSSPSRCSHPATTWMAMRFRYVLLVLVSMRSVVLPSMCHVLTWTSALSATSAVSFAPMQQFDHSWLLDKSWQRHQLLSRRVAVLPLVVASWTTISTASRFPHGIALAASCVSAFALLMHWLWDLQRRSSRKRNQIGTLQSLSQIVVMRLTRPLWRAPSSRNLTWSSVVLAKDAVRPLTWSSWPSCLAIDWSLPMRQADDESIWFLVQLKLS